MITEKVLVIGLGEVGLPLYELLVESRNFMVHGYDKNEDIMHKLDQKERPKKVDVMHICFPYLSRVEFVNGLANYVARFKPKLVIINSTIPPGTTIEVSKICDCRLIVHSPVRGTHRTMENFKRQLKMWRKYIGGANQEAAIAAQKHFQKAGFKTKILKSCLETELAKLFETTYRAWMIACFQEMHRISRYFQANFPEVVSFLEDTHRIRLDRPVMYPGVIGGHCLIPNIELLLERYDSKFLRLVLGSNERRKNEMKEKKISDDITKINIRSEALQAELMRKLEIEDY